MANKMLIDATHPEETRVVVLRGNRVEEFDFESASRKQLRGNIYLAKVTRVEPSLQAAFVDYGGNRHGFLAFSEIHPDYYQIPVADRQALIEAEEAEMAEAEARHERGRGKATGRRGKAAEASEAPRVREAAEGHDTHHDPDHDGDHEGDNGHDHGDDRSAEASYDAGDGDADTHAGHGHDGEHHVDRLADDDAPAAETSAETLAREATDEPHGEAAEPTDESAGNGSAEAAGDHDDDEVVSDEQVESVGAEDAMEEVPERRKPRLRQYKIQEVIKRRQVLLVQVVKEERGNKGAALTTYLSLAGRYSVLMPNTARGGGISRKITSLTDRKRLKQVVSDLEVPQGMGVILRTAGASRTRAEVKRDFEYLLRLWENVRELTLRSTAPTLVYEEGSLIKRSIRDLYNKDIDEVTVAGDDAYREAKDFMRMLMPSHAKNVQPYKDGQPLFARFGIEAQLDAMFSPQVTLRSGGYIVINQTEALVSIDVNSGRSTREHNIEDTALQTNLEAAEEVARQLRLRDLAGLIVIDFIDMEEKRNNRSVERKLKEALKNDRARIQVGRISHFGLLEMSRQRIRTGVLESTTSVCPTCQGTGHVRAPSSVALHVLRSLEDTLLKGATHHLTIRTRTPVALYILNQKRAHLSEMELRFGLSITVNADETIANGAHFVIERGEAVGPRAAAPTALVTPASVEPDLDAEETAIEDEAEEEFAEAGAEEHRDGEREDGEPRRRRRRRRGRGGEGQQRQGERPPQQRQAAQDASVESEGDEAEDGERQPLAADANGNGEDGQPRRRRRGRRGGRRGRRGRGGEPREHAPGEAVRPASTPQAFPTTGTYDEIDTTPTLDEPPAPVAARRADTDTLPYPDDEIDTTPREDDDQPGRDVPHIDVIADDDVDEIDTTPRDDRSGAAAPEAEDDANRPKRSGWWQRRSFFG